MVIFQTDSCPIYQDKKWDPSECRKNYGALISKPRPSISFCLDFDNIRFARAKDAHSPDSQSPFSQLTPQLG